MEDAGRGGFGDSEERATVTRPLNLKLTRSRLVTVRLAKDAGTGTAACILPVRFTAVPG